MHAPVLVTPPAEAPVSRTEAKAHLRVNGTDEDTLIDGLVSGAVSHLDGYAGVLGRCMVTQTWRQDFDEFSGNTLRLPLLAASIASVKTRASDGTLATVSADDYALKQDALGSYVRFDDEYSYPGDLAQANGILVEFTAGYGLAASVPAALKAAILLLIGHWYANREAVVTGTIATELPISVEALITPYRRVGI
jgi:uncharacterized phiE125 gp8 family phage protein